MGSSGNIESAQGKCDTLYVQERAGLNGTDINYIEARTFLGKCKNMDSSDDSKDNAVAMNGRGTADDISYNDDGNVSNGILLIVLGAVFEISVIIAFLSHIRFLSSPQHTKISNCS